MKNRNKFDIRILSLVMLFFTLIILVIGITYSLYYKLLEGSTSNLINTGTLYFSYNEGDFVSNGIDISNAYPISDSIGKNLIGKNEYFDFSVHGKTTVGDVNYEVVVLKQPNTTMHENFVKIYVTELIAGNEIPLSLVVDGNEIKTYDKLDDSKDQDGKIIYLGSIKDNTLNYTKNFRLRMWISDNAKATDDIYGKTFSVKVNVIGVQ